MAENTEIIRTVPAPVPAEHVVLTPDADSSALTLLIIDKAWWPLPVDPDQMRQLREQVLAEYGEDGRIGFQVADMLQGMEITEAVQKALPGQFAGRIEMRHGGTVVVECPARIVELA